MRGNNPSPLGVLEQRRVGEVDPVKDVKVTKTPLRHLQVRFEQEPNLARRGVTFSRVLRDARQHLLCPRAPLDKRKSSEVVDQRSRTANQSDIKQRCGSVEVIGSKVERLLDSADCVTKLHPGIPDRIPDRFGHLSNRTRPVMDQKKVEVASKAEIATSVATNGRQCHTLLVANAIDHRPEPGVDLSGIGPRESSAHQRRVGQDRRSSRNRVHTVESSNRRQPTYAARCLFSPAVPPLGERPSSAGERRRIRR